MSVDTENKTTDPTLRKYENPGATVIQMLLASKEGDVVFLRRYYASSYNIQIVFTLSIYIYNKIPELSPYHKVF